VYSFSRRLAWVAGVVLPVGETLRRWGTWWDFPLAYIDDVVLGAVLLLAAWRCRRGGDSGQAYLAAAWGFTLAVGFMSLADSVVSIARPDPSGVSGATAVAVKVVMVSMGVVATVGALRGPRAV
jgi:hypothetical protein